MIWQYLTVSSVYVSEPLPNLEPYGSAGWELVSVITVPAQIIFFFKRPKIAAKEPKAA